MGAKKRPIDLYEIDEEYLRASNEPHETAISLPEELE